MFGRDRVFDLPWQKGILRMEERPAEAAAARLPVRVAVRARPANSSDGEPCVAVTDNTVVIHSGEEEATFSFDAAFASEKAQHDVYAELVGSLLADTLADVCMEIPPVD